MPTWVDPPDSSVPGDVDLGMEVSVFDNLMDSDEELEYEENLLRGNSSTVPGVSLQNRFSPLVESPIGRETVIDEESLHSSDTVRRPAVSMTDGAEEEPPPSLKRRRPTGRLVPGTQQPVQDRDVELSLGSRPRSLGGDTLVSSEEELLVPSSRTCVACMESTVLASAGALLDAGVNESQFVRNVAETSIPPGECGRANLSPTLPLPVHNKGWLTSLSLI